MEVIRLTFMFQYGWWLRHKMTQHLHSVEDNDKQVMYIFV